MRGAPVESMFGSMPFEISAALSSTMRPRSFSAPAISAALAFLMPRFSIVKPSCVRPVPTMPPSKAFSPTALQISSHSSGSAYWRICCAIIFSEKVWKPSCAASVAPSLMMIGMARIALPSAPPLRLSILAMMSPSLAVGPVAAIPKPSKAPSGSPRKNAAYCCPLLAPDASASRNMDCATLIAPRRAAWPFMLVPSASSAPAASLPIPANLPNDPVIPKRLRIAVAPVMAPKADPNAPPTFVPNPGSTRRLPSGASILSSLIAASPRIPPAADRSESMVVSWPAASRGVAINSSEDSYAARSGLYTVAVTLSAVVRLSLRYCVRSFASISARSSLRGVALYPRLSSASRNA